MPQSIPLHERAANGVLEILHFVAVGRPVQRVRVRQAKQGRRLAQSFRVVPDPAIGVAIGMAG